MSDKEKRIVVLEVSPDCKALKFDCDPFDEEDGMFCDKNGKYVRITEKDCAKCKSPVLAGLTRAEAINKMSYALMLNGLEETDCKELATAALDALLGKEEGK